MKDELALRLEWLEGQSSQLEPDPSTRNAIDQKVLAYAHRFLNELKDAKAYNINLEASAVIESTDIPNEPVDIDRILQIYAEGVDTPGLNPASGGHLGYIPGGGIYTASLGDYLAAVGNRYAGIYYGSPGAVRMEHKLLQWMCGLFGYGDEAGGTLCSGGSIANLVAICAARDQRNLRPAMYEKAVVYLSDQTHHCVDKALRVAGLEYAKLHRIPLDDKQKMDPLALQKKIESDIQQGFFPWLVVASAGTTDTGAVDPLAAIGAICKKFELWFHIDAAYGGFFILTDECKHLFQGIECADSIVVDPHKGLFLPYGLGAVLLKNQKHLLRTNYYLANYMQDAYATDLPISPADLSPELTRHFRALRLWLPLQIHGLKTFVYALEEKRLLAKYAARELENIQGIELKAWPELSVVCFRIRPEGLDNIDQLNLRFIEYLKEDGKVFLSSTNLNGEVFIRMAILCFRTHKCTIDYALSCVKTFLDLQVYSRL
jgi:aromatic-L-amino-acid decarboxylase